MVQRWANPDDSDGEWVVEEIDGVHVRGPPANRFWKLRWVPYTDEETDVHEQARNSGAQDDGSYVHEWQPGDNCQRIANLQIQFWQNNRHLHPLSSIEVDGEHRCQNCNAIQRTERKLSTHIRTECPTWGQARVKKRRR